MGAVQKNQATSVSIEAKDDVSITTGTASASVSQVAGKTATINAAAMLDTNTLTLSGAGMFVVSNLVADLAGSGVSGTINVTAGAGSQVITGGSGIDTITGGTGADWMSGNEGNDIFLISAASDHDAAEIITGGLDTDQIRFTSSTGETLVLASGVNVEEARISTAAGLTTGTSAENINASLANGGIALYGNNGANILIGNTANNLLVGLEGADSLEGGDGNDTLIGGAGPDSLLGGGGNDLFEYASLAEINDPVTGDTTLLGGIGSDKVLITQAGNITFSDNNFTKMKEIEELEFTTTGSLQVTFDTNADSAFASTDSVVLTASSAFSLTLIGGSSNIAITASGNSQADSFTTGAGNDSITGGLGNDVINVGFGADTVNGGGGSDIINLGSDSDSDLLIVGTVSSTGIDSITNFLPSYLGQTLDQIKFSSVDAYTRIGAPLEDGGPDLGFAGLAGTLGGAIVYTANQIGDNQAAGFSFNGQDYILIDKAGGATDYDTSVDAVIRVTGSDLTLFSTNNFIA